MASFPYPKHILHRVVEPQWFPSRKEETESSLTAVEAAEEAHAQRLYRIVTENTPTAGTPIIGRLADSSAPSAGSGRRSRQRSSRGGSSSTTPDAANPTDPSPPTHPAGHPVTTSTATGTRDGEAAMAMASPPTISSSQRFWNRAGTSRRSSGAQTISY